MKIDIPQTAHKVREFGGRYHPRQKGTDEHKRQLLRNKCDKLGIEPVLEGTL